MELRCCGLDDCAILEYFQSSVKYFQEGRYTRVAATSLPRAHILISVVFGHDSEEQQVVVGLVLHIVLVAHRQFYALWLPFRFPCEALSRPHLSDAAIVI